MKTFAALIRRYVLATAAIVLLVGGLLVGQIFYVGFKSNAVDATGYRVGTLADALKQTETGLQWGREHTPAEWMQGYAWAMVLDADGLNALQGCTEKLDVRRGRVTILTPHDGEFARLTDRTLREIASSERTELASRFACEHGCILVL